MRDVTRALGIVAERTAVAFPGGSSHPTKKATPEANPGGKREDPGPGTIVGLMSRLGLSSRPRRRGLCPAGGTPSRGPDDGNHLQRHGRCGGSGFCGRVAGDDRSSSRRGQPAALHLDRGQRDQPIQPLWRDRRGVPRLRRLPPGHDRRDRGPRALGGRLGRDGQPAGGSLGLRPGRAGSLDAVAGAHRRGPGRGRLRQDRDPRRRRARQAPRRGDRRPVVDREGLRRGRGRRRPAGGGLRRLPRRDRGGGLRGRPPPGRALLEGRHQPTRPRSGTGGGLQGRSPRRSGPGHERGLPQLRPGGRPAPLPRDRPAHRASR